MTPPLKPKKGFNPESAPPREFKNPRSINGNTTTGGHTNKGSGVGVPLGKTFKPRAPKK